MDGKAVFHGNSNFKTWLFGVIRNTAIDLHRKKQLRSRHRCLFQYQEEQTHASSDPAIQTEQNHELSILVKALSSLPKRQKEVLYLVFYQGLTIEEAGKVLKISLGSARKHYERGKMNLRKSLLEWRATA
jgi:RNA polymerase sigma-70 factor (ECF subfamily)